MSDAGELREGAWNPGLTSTIPRRLRPDITLFQAGNATLDHAAASDLADLCGLPLEQLASLRTERLVVHELLVRVTADYSVADGPNYADLGISLRAMVARLMERHVAPELDAIRAAVEAERERVRGMLERELATTLFGDEAGSVGESVGQAGIAPDDGARTDVTPAGGAASPVRSGERTLVDRLFAALSGACSSAGSSGASSDGSSTGSSVRPFTGWFARSRTRRTPSRPATTQPVAPREERALATWRRELDGLGPDPSLERRCIEALARTVEAIVAHRGRLLASRESIGAIAFALLGNALVERVIGERIGLIVAKGAELEGYRRLPAQARPIVMNVKGASAAGKSTIRPRQRRLADKLGVSWQDFALISPDYWRKYLLDYESLGEDRRYGAMLCGQELVLVDRKLDRYMAAKAARGEMSHLLIDRFRFDSFTLAKDRTGDSRLLTRFGHEIYLFFMITPPAETVTRAWTRGQSTGRFKAVDDLLHHNVEAFTGMPALFLSWVNAEGRRVHFEFLDNDVPEGTEPATAAFGWNGRMTILDVRLMRAIDRYRHVDVAATCPEEVLPAPVDTDDRGSAFVLRCIDRIERVDFMDRDTARIYARVERGRLVGHDEAHIATREDADVVRAVLASLPSSGDDLPDASGVDVAHEARFTVGRWGPAASPGHEAVPAAPGVDASGTPTAGGTFAAAARGIDGV